MKFQELDDTAKDRAREIFRYASLAYNWWEGEYQYFNDILEDMGFMGVEIKGFDIDRGAQVVWEASFNGNNNHDKANVPEPLMYIYDRLREIDTLGRLEHEDGYLFISCSNAGRYGHDPQINLGIYDDEDEHNLQTAYYDTIVELLKDIEAWMLKVLRDAYEYRLSDECVDDFILANEYEFDEDGDQV